MSALLTSPRPLVARDLTKAYGDRVVLSGIDLLASPGTRIGLVGENGAGKSTLLRIVAGRERPDAGTVDRPDDFAYLPQEPPFDDADTVADVLDQALAPLHQAVREVERLAAAMADGGEATAAYVRALEWAEHHDAWGADRRAAVAAETLGVADLSRDRPMGSLSGGQRTRLAMAAVITRRPDCVLLDEPTNHLDDGAMELLESFLVDLPGIVVAASHDRVFLDAVCTHVVDLDPSALGTDGRGGNRYGGGFSDYLGHKADSRRRWDERFATEQQRIAELRRATRVDTSAVAHGRGPTDNDKFIHKFKGANVQRAATRRAHDAVRRLEVAEREQVARPPAPLAFDATLTGSADPSAVAVSIRDLRVAGRVQVPVLDVPTGGRLLVTGPNGSGKSSLLAVVDGRLAADSGTVVVGARSVGTLVQDVTFADPRRTARQTYAGQLGVERAGTRPLEDLGLLHPRDLGRAVADLSVGQRRRLALAILVGRQPDLLLLDEPTNHISLALAAELEDALDAAPGTVLVASHDRWLRRRWTGEVLALSPARG